MDLFGDVGPAAPSGRATPALSQRRKRLAGQAVGAAAADDALRTLASQLPRGLRLGASSWYFPGWAGLVWDDTYPETMLSRRGLPAYAQHPLLRAVSLDRAFYRALTADQYAAYAAQVPDDFRFSVKAPGMVCDAVSRDESGRGRVLNPHFLSADLAVSEFVRPTLLGLGDRCGPLVFQISPLPGPLLRDLSLHLMALDRLLDACASELAAYRLAQPGAAPDAMLAVEVRNPQWISGDAGGTFAQVLKRHGATYCLGLHAKMPPIDEQLPMLRALWPGPLVCRWSLHRKHGAFGYSEAKDLYDPFDRLVDPDPDTRGTLAKVIAGTLAAGYSATVTINNKAEGSAPLSALELARVVAALRPQH
jgi:uncharacterized protein YecE (DUF72 family)